MKVVITGGAGFIGSNLTRHWVTRHPEDRVVVVDALTYAGRRESLSDLEGRPNYTLVVADIGDPAKMEAVLQGADVVLNLAAESHNDRAISNPLPFVRTNILGTAVLLEACRKRDVGRFHHVSTDEVYGSLSLDDPARFTEASPYRPRGPYSASKASSDHLVRAWTETYGLRTTISNCGNNFGPYQFPEKLIPLAITRLMRGAKVPLYGDGQNVRDWIFVADHCDAIDAIAHRGIPGSTYLVSAEHEVSNREVIDQLLKLFGRGPEAVEFVPDRLGHDRRYGLDARRLRQELGWTPKHDFSTALAQTVGWYRSNVTWWEPLLSG
ncbi:MAG TPA: dTDP-glucose 4,6-dehydratase [Thermoplasmata archaeon]|jgi:dTDP-glucose 4,6-dehydratase